VPDDEPRPSEPLLTKLRRRVPSSPTEWAWLLATVASALVVAWHAARVLAPVLTPPALLGRHDWDQAEALRYLVMKSLRVFHTFPSWNPYACGGHPAWASPDGDPNVVSPVLPAYLLLSLRAALHVEIVFYALTSAVGTWLLASRFTRSPALRALAVVVFAFDGRWALQLAGGHLWHGVYALVPWVLFFLDRAIGAEPALGPARRGDVVWAGACLALMVYAGGAYPWPQTVILLGVYALWLAIAMRSLWPLGALGLTAAVAFGLSAPKLLPALDVMARYPRVTIAAVGLSPETLSSALLDPTQTFRTSAPGVGPDAWLEVGIYVGTLAAAWLVLGSILAGGRREQPLRALAAIFVVLSLGPFHPYAPWTFARELPVLSSQAMPSRWMYLAVLLTACAAAGASEGLLVHVGRTRTAVELALVAVVAWISVDISAVARVPLLAELNAPPPAGRDSTAPFVTETRLPASLQLPDTPGPASLPAEGANLGTIECNTFPGLSNHAGIAATLPQYDGRPSGIGARGRDETDYKGEAYLLEGRGLARIASWAPGTVEVSVQGAQPGDHLVLNQNWDPGWSVKGADAWSYHNAIAATLKDGKATVVFRYHSRFAWLGLLLLGATVGALVYQGRMRRRVGRGVLLS
jgi:hypothetical protein